MNQKERLVIWRAFSELFLDVELNDAAYQWIAKSVQESQLPISEAERILWYEVFPVLEKNLNSVAGVWDGWSDSWLLANLQTNAASGKILGSRANIKIIQDSWSKVLFFLNVRKEHQ